MKYIEKKEVPPPYKKWFDANNATWQNSDLTAEEIFDKITDKKKRTLNKHLLVEQGHICAYCGKRIGKGSEKGELLTFSVDHFESKSFNRPLVLVPHNLLGACKMSRYESKKVNLSSTKSTPKTYKNIADELGIDIEDFTGKGWIKDDDDLVALNISEVKYRDSSISLHCDDGKEERLKKIGWQGKIEKTEKYVINPTKSVDCASYFEYTMNETGIHCDIKAVENLLNTQRAKNTIDVFKLNIENLCKARADAWKTGRQILMDSQKRGLDIEDILDVINSVDKDGKLQPFCFVIAHFLEKWL